MLAAAWRRYLRGAGEAPVPAWRARCGAATLLLAACSTMLELFFFFSWFHNGGSPHGMLPSPGVWTFVGRIALWTLVTSIALSPLGKVACATLGGGFASTMLSPSGLVHQNSRAPEPSHRRSPPRLTRAIHCPACVKLQNPGEKCRNAKSGTDIREVKNPLAGLRFGDLRHHAITELAESQTNDQAIMSIAGHVSQRMLAHLLAHGPGLT